jgi:hypothetical protein
LVDLLALDVHNDKGNLETPHNESDRRALKEIVIGRVTDSQKQLSRWVRHFQESPVKLILSEGRLELADLGSS